MSLGCHYFDVMKRENKQTYTYATKPSIKGKAEKLAEKEGITLSEKIDEFLVCYTSRKSGDVYFDNIGTFLMQESNKKKK